MSRFGCRRRGAVQTHLLLSGVRFCFAHAAQPVFSPWTGTPSLGASHVDWVSLQENTINGSLPACVWRLAELQVLTLASNRRRPSHKELLEHKQAHGRQSLLDEFQGISGALPAEIGNLRQLIALVLRENILSASLPEALGSMTSLRVWDVSDNDFEGSLPASIGRLSHATALYVFRNELEGAFPPDLLSFVYWTKMLIQYNLFTGSLPAQLFRVTTLGVLAANDNHLAGSIPEAIGLLTDLAAVWLSWNRMEGSLPAAFFGLPKLAFFEVYQNQWGGTLPDALGKVSNIYGLELFLHHCDLAGSIPHNVAALSHMRVFYLAVNRLRGTIPEGTCELSDTSQIVLAYNELAGSVPIHRSWCHVDRLVLNDNMLSGTLPHQLAALSELKKIIVQRNHLMGTLPSAVEQLANLRIVTFAEQIGGLEGSLPSKLGWRCTALDAVDLSYAGHLEGRIPETLGRMRHDETDGAAKRLWNLVGVIVLAPLLELQGSMPSFHSTLLFLSLYGNRIQGSIPSLELIGMRGGSRMSHILLHNNDLSCQVPRFNDVELPQHHSLVLCGNMLSYSKHSYDDVSHRAHTHGWRPLQFPPWIDDSEKSDFFVVSNRQGVSLLVKALSGGCLCFALASWWELTTPATVASSGLPWTVSRECLWQVYHVSVRALSFLAVASCPLLLFYVNTPANFECMPVLQRLQMPSMGIGASGNHVTMLLWLVCLRLARMAEHSVQEQSDWSAPSTSAMCAWLSVACMWMTWIILSLCMSLPLALYNMAKAVPGFLGSVANHKMMRSMLIWFLSATVALLHQIFTCFLAPNLARAVQRQQQGRVAVIDLLSWVSLLSGCLVPALTLAIFHPRCMQGWTLLWRPCRGDGLTITGSVQMAEGFFFQPPWYLQRSEDICSPSQTNPFSSRCLHSIIDHSVDLLQKGAVQGSFVVPILQVCQGKPIERTTAAMTVWNLWQTAVVFGVSAPVLLILLAATAFTHHRMLFVEPYSLLDRDTLLRGSLGWPLSAQACTFVIAFAVMVSFCLLQQMPHTTLARAAPALEVHSSDYEYEKESLTAPRGL